MTEMLQSLMQDDFPLTLNHIRRRMRDCNAGAELVTLLPDGSVARASHHELAGRIDRVARMLARLGIEQGDRVASFAWNNQRHFELYMGAPCVGAVLHTLNVRLFAEQLTYIVNHAEDRVIFVDDSLVATLEPLAASFECVEHFVVMGDGDAGSLPGALRYEELLADAGEGSFDYPELDERQAAALCYTSGTTGNPKGVLYSHRSISLHSSATLMADGSGLSRKDRVLAVVPMFHANAWGLPYGAALAGSDLILPDRFLGAEALAGLIAVERPTLMGCVPTIFNDLLRYADEHPEVDLSSLTNAACGGSAVPRQLMKDFEERHDVRIFQAWGMTETSPVATYARPREGEHDDAYWDDRAKQGRPLPWVELRLVDDSGASVPWDGTSTGEIEVRGPWIAAGYFREEDEEKFDSGWLRTGDIAAVDETSRRPPRCRPCAASPSRTSPRPLHGKSSRPRSTARGPRSRPWRCRPRGRSRRCRRPAVALPTAAGVPAWRDRPSRRRRARPRADGRRSRQGSSRGHPPRLEDAHASWRSSKSFIS